MQGNSNNTGSFTTNVVKAPKKKEVEDFLKEVGEIIGRSANNFVFDEYGPKNKAGTQYSNDTCELYLDYDRNDVMNEILSLTYDNFSERKWYRDGKFYYVFGKIIKSKQIYIKLRIKKLAKGKTVICVSFHFAEYEMTTVADEKKK